MLNTLVLDIETAPMTAYVWGRKDINISLSQITNDWSILAWSAKWLGSKKVIYRDQRHAKDKYNDKEMLLPLWKLLDKAQIVITQNGQSFDARKLNARFILNGMGVPSPYRHFDTYRLANRIAAFTSNSLEYLTDKLCVKYKKLSHGRFPGMSLWVECLKGNKKAWAEMKRYNIHDTLSTEELYMKLRAWAPDTFPKPFFIPGDNRKCGTCGNHTLVKHAKAITKTAAYQMYRCKHCGACPRGEKLK